MVCDHCYHFGLLPHALLDVFLENSALSQGSLALFGEKYHELRIQNQLIQVFQQVLKQNNFG